MEAEIKWLDNPEVFRVNQMPAHSDHPFFEDEESFGAGESRLCQSLNGDWRFHYSENAKRRPAEFFKEDFDRSSFDTITVPGHIELAGYDKIHYINSAKIHTVKHRLNDYTAAKADNRADCTSTKYYNC